MQHVAPRHFKPLHSWSDEPVPITPLSRDEKSNQKMRENWISKGNLERGETSHLSLCSYPAELRGAGVLFPFVDCRALPWRRLSLLYPLLRSNPSLSCTVCLWDRYQPLRHWGSQLWSLAASLIMDLCSANRLAGFIYCTDRASLSVSIRKVIKVVVLVTDAFFKLGLGNLLFWGWCGTVYSVKYSGERHGWWTLHQIL